MAIFDLGGMRLDLDIPPSVYVPSDDTQMLAEAALGELGKKAAARRRLKILEIGCGSGAVSLALAKNGKTKEILACDISKEAVETARKNAEKNKIKLDVVCSNLFSAFSASKKFDWILFNPPYLPTAKAEKVKGKLNDALDGGKDGLKTVKPFLEQAGEHLAKGGKILMVVSSLQPKEKLVKMMERNGFGFDILAEQSFFFEKLQVWMIWKLDS